VEIINIQGGKEILSVDTRAFSFINFICILIYMATMAILPQIVVGSACDQVNIMPQNIPLLCTVLLQKEIRKQNL